MILVILKKWLTVTLVAFVLAACSNPSTMTANPNTDPKSTPVASLFFPQQTLTNPPNDVMNALLIGKLIVRDDCLRVINEGGISYLVIWPSDATLQITNDVIEILDQNGQPIAQVGGRVELGGGESSIFQLREPIPESCSGPYWVVGKID